MITETAQRDAEPAELSRRTMLKCIGATTAALSIPGAAMAARPQEALPVPKQGVGKLLLLAIDQIALPLRKNLVLYLSQPQTRVEPVLTPNAANPNAPDSLAVHFYGTVLHDQGKFRMWYYPCNWGPNPDWPAEAKHQLERYDSELFLGPLCYAESEDGVHWNRPNLGQMKFKGDRNNNALGLPDALTHGANLIRDDDDPDPLRRYKLIYLAYEYTSERIWGYIRTATSPDGLNWTVGPTLPSDDFIEQASFYKHNGLYIINGQKAGTHWRGEGGHLIGRQGFAWVSPDFNHWLTESADSFSLPEPVDPTQRGVDKPYDQVHIGVGASSFGNVLVGLYGIWHNNPEFNKINCDLGLLISNDGFLFREPAKGHRFLKSQESPVTPANSANWPNVLTQGNGILNVGDKTLIYHGRWRNAPVGPDYYAEVALATLPRDRWGALGLTPDETRGSVWTAPFVLADHNCQLFLNAEGIGGIKVEVADQQFNLLPAFSGQNSGVAAEDSGLDCSVVWSAADLASLAGKAIRFRIHLEKKHTSEPRLYALSLRGGAGQVKSPT